MPTKFSPVSQELYEELLPFVGADAKEIVSYIYRERLCSIKMLIDKFPEVAAESAMEMLSVLGRANGSIFSKFNAAVYPAEVGSSILDSAYSLGVLTKGE